MPAATNDTGEPLLSAIDYDETKWGHMAIHIQVGGDNFNSTQPVEKALTAIDSHVGQIVNAEAPGSKVALRRNHRLWRQGSWFEGMNTTSRTRAPCSMPRAVDAAPKTAQAVATQMGRRERMCAATRFRDGPAGCTNHAHAPRYAAPRRVHEPSQQAAAFLLCGS